jgi:DNA-binding GntR family transcriptional regulator
MLTLFRFGRASAFRKEDVAMTLAPQFTLVKKGTNLRGAVTHALRHAIICGEMRPGKVYSAPALGARFGVSPTPVREAMLDLVKEGMVISVPNKGFRVTEVSEADVADVTRLRLLIEPPTVRQIVPMIPESAFPRLRRLAHDVVEPAVRGKLFDYTAADRRFHLWLLEFSGNRRLVDTVATLFAQTRLLGPAGLTERGELGSAAAEHVRLVDLIEARDAPGAEELMTRHIGHACTP